MILTFIRTNIEVTGQLFLQLRILIFEISSGINYFISYKILIWNKIIIIFDIKYKKTVQNWQSAALQVFAFIIVANFDREIGAEQVLIIMLKASCIRQQNHMHSVCFRVCFLRLSSGHLARSWNRAKRACPVYR